MIYSGKTLSVEVLPSGVANLVFDLEDSSVNKFNQQTLRELQEAVAVLQSLKVPNSLPCFLTLKNPFCSG